jgi:peptidyl-prolyl cis-trans isomerase A (cyclophilin A)
MIQGGDPFCGRDVSSSYKDIENEFLAEICGTGGPGYAFEDEIDPNTPSYKRGYKKGVLAMANSGVNTNGSQFFIMVNNVPLAHNYTIFGSVISGQEVADRISLVKRDSKDRPLEPVTINRVTIK